MSISANLCPAAPAPWRTAAGVALQGAILAMFFAASAAPTPLYRLYQDQWGFSPVMLTVVFAAYAASLLLALLTVGALSDYVGRRPVICAALVLEIAAMALFIAADSANALIGARLLQGFATGAATSVLGAALIDGSRKHGALINSVAPLVGMAVGAVGAGLMASYADAPTLAVYRLLAAIFLLQTILIWGTPETVRYRPGALFSLLPRVHVPHAARGALLRITPLNIALWSMGAFSLSLMPSLVRSATGVASPLLGGILVCALTLPGAASVLLMREQSAARCLMTGTVFLSGGFAVLLAGVHAGSVTLLVAGMLVIGIGFGSGFLGAVRSIVPLAQQHERGALLSAYYIESYIAFSLPAIAAGALARDVGLEATADIYGAFIIAFAIIGVLVRPR
ncbi:MFS transporter [Azorhizobium oxalatiphilum]|uniref:MFS transporter n=1 Tax=Azorhizobium oxalatiphilum TaxID=980631 RepID=A0A917BU31_9HYPH|nr:MFS transporter [Azorhizobium oxalatiphilum]GGF55929.1 MFS transporter [Azorhizobium oxalatiphilum]